MRGKYIQFVSGAIIGAVLVPTTYAAVQQLTATPSTQRFYVDGKQVRLEAYAINGNNYVKLRDIGEAVGFNVGYDSATNSVYIGEQPIITQPTPSGTVTLPTDGSKYIPQAGDRVRCDDGYIYEIKDVRRYDNNVFADGPVGPLPTPTCDWSVFPSVEVPAVEVRHFADSGDNSMFIYNTFETRRMQYTIYNALGKEPSVWQNGKLLASVQLTIPKELGAYTKVSWPWRASDLENMVHSRPSSRFYVEAWDCYSNGVFQHTRYCVVSL